MPESRSPIFWTSDVCSSSAGLRPTARTAFAEWKSARSLLASTIRSYLSACATLHTACASAVSQPTERPIIEEALITIDSELESLALEENMLRDGRALLSVTRNNSTTLVRTNTLPSEILAKIFTFSKTYCILDSRCGSNPDAFARVCVHWRRTAIAAADLWTHVDIGKTISDSQIKLLLGRSKDSPIQVHAFEPEHTDLYSADRKKYRHAVREMMKPLQPHLHRLHVLNIDGTTYEEFICVILRLWSSCDYVNGAPTSLLVEGREHYGDNIINIRNHLGGEPENLERMLLAVSNLRLFCAMFDWASSAYRGLVDLRLNLFPASYISRPELFGILSSCPALHTLKLGYIGVVDDEDWVQNPIAMRSLEVLKLTNMEIRSIGRVLSLITVPEFRTELGISLYSNSELDEQLVEFFARSKLATLYCYRCPGYSTHNWEHLIQHLPHSNTLILNNFDLTPKTWLNAPINLSEFRPLVNSIVFLECKLELAVLWGFIVSFEPQELRFELRPPSYARQHSSSFNARQHMEDIRTSLLEICPELQCSISDTDSTENLACRTN